MGGFGLPRGRGALGLILVLVSIAAPASAQKRNTAVRWNEQALSGSGDFKIFKFETFSGSVSPLYSFFIHQSHNRRTHVSLPHFLDVPRILQ